MIERLLLAIEQLRVALKGYDLLDEATKKSVRHQIYTRTGDFGKILFKPYGDECVAALYSRKEEELNLPPLVRDIVTVKVAADGTISLVDLPPHMSFVVVKG